MLLIHFILCCTLPITNLYCLSCLHLHFSFDRYTLVVIYRLHLSLSCGKLSFVFHLSCSDRLHFCYGTLMVIYRLQFISLSLVVIYRLYSISLSLVVIYRLHFISVYLVVIYCSYYYSCPRLLYSYCLSILIFPALDWYSIWLSVKFLYFLIFIRDRTRKLWFELLAPYQLGYLKISRIIFMLNLSINKNSLIIKFINYNFDNSNFIRLIWGLYSGSNLWITSWKASTLQTRPFEHIKCSGHV